MGLRHVLTHGRCIQVPNNSGLPLGGTSNISTTIAAIKKPEAIIRNTQYEGLHRHHHSRKNANIYSLSLFVSSGETLIQTQLTLVNLKTPHPLFNAPILPTYCTPTHTFQILLRPLHSLPTT
jgi:hypothetical protein